MKKKLFSMMLALTMTAGLLAGCGSSGSSSDGSADAGQESAEESSGSEGAADSEEASGGEEASDSGEGTKTASDIKIGVIYVGDENEGYTAAHMEGIDAMMEELGISDEQVIEKTNILEDESCYDAAVDLADNGCDMIFATSFGHEEFLLQAAAEYPEIDFYHATGYQAAGSGLSNMHNYFDAIYEARYAAGVAAGMKLNEMIEDGKVSEDAAKIGYVGAFPYAEVISGFTSFYLGAKSVCPSVTMEVQYTNKWADMSGENEIATKLIEDGCVLISQHADTTGAPSACQDKGVPCVGYNVDMISVAPDTAITSAANNWGAYYTIAVSNYLSGTANPVDWCEGYAQDAVYLTPLNEAVIAEGTEEKVAEVESALKEGSLHVFDTSTFTVDGASLEDKIAEGGDYAAYEQYVSDGYFHESELASAPAFNIIIDGITVPQQ